MKRIWVFLLSAPLFGQAILSNRYIVQLSQDPVAVHAGAPRTSALHSAAAELHRSRVRAQQAGVRAEIERRQGSVLGALENVGNFLTVQIDDAQAASLAAIPGVVSVQPERTFHLLLDHALVVHRAIDAWNQVGAGNAGAGIKIGIIDTGIDVGHPGFSDSSFRAPTGFPVSDTTADRAYTNNKVIVARSYASKFASADPDPSAADHVGHGTATAMAAAGVTNTGPLATITGMAPRAYLGNYKVFGTPGVNDSATESAVLQAIEDAVTDGMDVISMSLGSDLATRLASDSEVQAIAHAASLGVIVVVAAGNNGPDPQTVASPGDAPAAITAGASNNNRLFAGTVTVQVHPRIDTRGHPALHAVTDKLVAVPGNGSNSTAPIAAALTDVTSLDGNGLACNALPANSLKGTIALIFRGTCTFEIKLGNALAAGAIGAVVYDNVAGEDPITMGVGSATLPAAMVSNSDGLMLKAQVAGGLSATLSFATTPGYSNPARIASFSAEGPNVASGIKPDVLAVGMNLYTAAQKLDRKGALYDATGYAVEQGTSFSAPLVAGAAAVLKQAKPGLTVDQYRSLLIDTAAQAWLVPGTAATVQQAGGGVLDVLASINAPVAAVPVSLSFGTGGSSINSSQTLTLTNTGKLPDTFTLSVTPRVNGSAAPQLGVSSVQLNPEASVAVPVQFQANGLTAGSYEGVIGIQGTASSYSSHVPYWYGVPSNQPAHITVLYNAGSNGNPTAGSHISQAVIFRITDASGLAVSGLAPSISVVSSGAQATGLISMDSLYPNAYAFDVRLSTLPGANVFQIQAGSVTLQVTITGQ